MDNGVKTNLLGPSNSVDSLIGNKDGSTVRIPADLIAGFLATQPPMQSLLAGASYSVRPTEPIHSDFKINLAGQWFGAAAELWAIGGQSQHVRWSITELGESQGNVFARVDTGWQVATPAMVGDIIYTEAHRVSKAKGRPIFIVHGAVGGTTIGRWVPGGDLYDALMDRADDAFSELLALGYQIAKSVMRFAQGEGEWSLGPLGILSTERYPALIRGIRSRLWAGPNCQIIFSQLLREEEGGTAARVNQEWERLMSAGYPGVHLISSEGVGTEDPTGGPEQVVHFDAPGRVTIGLRGADIQLGLSLGVTSGDVAGRVTATGERIWKERAFTSLPPLRFGPSNLNHQTISLLGIITGTMVLLEINGVTTDFETDGGTLPIDYDTAADADVRIWVPTDVQYHQPVGLSINQGVVPGTLRSIVFTPLVSMSQVYLASHAELQHSVEPRTWPRQMQVFRLDGCPLATFDNFVAADLPPGLTILSFSANTPVPQWVRDAISAENTKRGNPITVTYGTAYVPANSVVVRPETVGAGGSGATNDHDAMIRFAATAGDHSAKSQAVYASAARTATIVFSTGSTFDFKGSTFLQDWTLNNANTVMNVSAGARVDNLGWFVTTANFHRRGVAVYAGVQLSGWRIEAATPFPAVDDVRDGGIIVRGPDVQISDMHFHGHSVPIRMYDGADQSRGVIKDVHLWDFFSGISLRGGGFVGGVIDGVYLHGIHPSATTDPGQNVITEGAPYAVVSNIFQLFAGKGSGEHFIYSSVVDGTKGMVFDTIFGNGSGQSFMKWRGHDEMSATNCHGGPTSFDNAPGTNEDGFRIEYTRNSKFTLMSCRSSSTKPSGYDGIHINNSWNLEFAQIRLGQCGRSYIRCVTPTPLVDYTAPPNLAVENINIDGLYGRGSGSLPLLSLGSDAGDTTVKIGNITIRGLDWDGSLENLVVIDGGVTLTQIAGTAIRISGFCSGVAFDYVQMAGEAAKVTQGLQMVTPEQFGAGNTADDSDAFDLFFAALQSTGGVGIMRGNYTVSRDFAVTAPINLDGFGSTVTQTVSPFGFLQLMAGSDGSRVANLTVVADLTVPRVPIVTRYRGYGLAQRHCALWVESGNNKIRHISGERLLNTLCLRGPVVWYPAGAGYTGADTDPNTAFDYSGHVDDNDVFDITGKTQDFAITGHQQRNLTLIKYGLRDIVDTNNAPPHAIYMRSNGTGVTAGTMIGGLISQGTAHNSPDGVGHKFHDCIGTSFADLAAYDASGVCNFIDCLDCSWSNLTGQDLAGDNTIARYAHNFEGSTGRIFGLHMDGISNNTIGLLEVKDGAGASDLLVMGASAKTDFRIGNAITETLIRAEGATKLKIKGLDYIALGDDARYMLTTADTATINVSDPSCTGLTLLANAAGGKIHANYDPVQMAGTPLTNSGNVTTSLDEQTRKFEYGASMALYGTTVAGAHTYTVKRCWVERVGNRVTLSIYVDVNGAFGGTGNVRFGPLPYAIADDSASSKVDIRQLVLTGDNITVASGNLVASLIDGLTYIALQTVTGLTRANLAHTALASNAAFQVQVSYYTSDAF